MTHLRRFVRRVLALFRTGRDERDLSREIAAHLQLLEDGFTAGGMSRADARRAAKRAFGGVEQAKELQRDARTFRSLAGWPMDLRLGARMLVKSPGLTVIAVVALAVAIGGGAAYMEFVNDFFRPTLAFPGGDRLVGLLTYDVAKGDVETRALRDYAVWKGSITKVEHLGASRLVEHNLTTDDARVEPVRGTEISASAFIVFPSTPLLGRPLVAEDEKPGAAPVFVVGEALWRARFNADPSVVGRAFRLDATPHTLVGVMPASWSFPTNQVLWTPWRLDAASFEPAEGPAVRIFGRLVDGASVEEAQAEIETLAAGSDIPARRWAVMPYVASLWAPEDMGWQMTALYSFNIFFLGLLGLCAVNVATLVFARTATREGEITVRTALGASRGRIVSQLVAEALVFTSIAAVVGLLAAPLILRRVRDIWVSAQGTQMPFWWNESLGVETMAYAALLVIVASLVVGGVPALKATGPEMQARLKAAGSTGSTMRFGRLWTGIIVAQIAVTVVFLMTVVSFALTGLTKDQQFNDVSVPRHEFLTAHVRFSDGASDENWTAVLRELHRRLNDDPGIINAAYTVRLPGGSPEEFWLEFADPALNAAAQARKSGDVLWTKSARVGANYFETMTLGVVAGRTFSDGEVEEGRNVAVVDESFVRLLLDGRSPVGLLVRQPPTDVDAQPGPWFEITGVVGDIARVPGVKTSDGMLYRPRVLGGNAMARVVVHSRAADAAARLRAAAAAIHPELRIAELMTLERYAEIEAQTHGFFTAILAVVSTVALLLSTAGIYALIAFTLSRRTREIGLRSALGGSPSRIIRGILSRAFVQIAAGVVVGSIPGTAMILFDSEIARSHGPWTAAWATLGVALFITAVAAVSCLPPVRRALRVQPIEALRAEG
jgi:predicted permease